MLENAYEAAIERVAGAIGVTPDELERRIDEAREQLVPTDECLTLGELVFDKQPPEPRRDHVSECKFCQTLVRVSAASEEEINRFIKAMALV
ncbi:MAG: hypothetical protein NTZ05_04100 [Chloroflexi bacterium]|nr:hypothetical protein [Chloroflexota bacterium]